MNKILIVALLLCSFTSAMAEETEEVKKWDIIWEYHLITWLSPNTERYDNVFSFKKERRCRTFLKRIELVLEGAREVPGFGWVGICSPVQKS